MTKRLIPAGMSRRASLWIVAGRRLFSDGRTLLGAASVRDFDGGYADGPRRQHSLARCVDWQGIGRFSNARTGLDFDRFSPDGIRLLSGGSAGVLELRDIARYRNNARRK